MEEFIHVVLGIKVNDEKFKELHEDYMKEKRGEIPHSKLFNLHEDVYGLDGYWIGNHKNPEGLIIGCSIFVTVEKHKEINLLELNEAIAQHKDYKDYEYWANEFLNKEKFEKFEDFKLHVFKEILD